MFSSFKIVSHLGEEEKKMKAGFEQISIESGILMSSPGQRGFTDRTEALPNAPNALYLEQASGKPCAIAHRSLDSD